MKPQKKAFIMAAVTGLLTTFLHYGATMFYWYWTYHGFDKIVHFTAGAFVGFVFIWLYFNIYNHGKYIQPVLFVVLSVLLVGLLWEVFEALTKTTGVLPGQSYVFDTVTDLIADVVGGIAAYGVIFLPLKKKKYEES